jgi:hypothetical protein
MHPADPAPDWLWRMSLCDGGAETRIELHQHKSLTETFLIEEHNDKRQKTLYKSIDSTLLAVMELTAGGISLLQRYVY